jgi:hypothetical protein
MDPDAIDEFGPVDYLVVDFPARKSDSSGEMAAELLRLHEAGTIRVLDLIVASLGADDEPEGA